VASPAGPASSSGPIPVAFSFLHLSPPRLAGPVALAAGLSAQAAGAQQSRGTGALPSAPLSATFLSPSFAAAAVHDGAQCDAASAVPVFRVQARLAVHPRSLSASPAAASSCSTAVVPGVGAACGPLAGPGDLWRPAARSIAGAAGAGTALARHRATEGAGAVDSEPTAPYSECPLPLPPAYSVLPLPGSDASTDAADSGAACAAAAYAGLLPAPLPEWVDVCLLLHTPGSGESAPTTAAAAAADAAVAFGPAALPFLLPPWGPAAGEEQEEQADASGAGGRADCSGLQGLRVLLAPRLAPLAGHESVPSVASQSLSVFNGAGACIGAAAGSALLRGAVSAYLATAPALAARVMTAPQPQDHSQAALLLGPPAEAVTHAVAVAAVELSCSPHYSTGHPAAALAAAATAAAAAAHHGAAGSGLHHATAADVSCALAAVGELLCAAAAGGFSWGEMVWGAGAVPGLLPPGVLCTLVNTAAAATAVACAVLAAPLPTYPEPQAGAEVPRLALLTAALRWLRYWLAACQGAALHVTGAAASSAAPARPGGGAALPLGVGALFGVPARRSSGAPSAAGSSSAGGPAQSMFNLRARGAGGSAARELDAPPTGTATAAPGTAGEWVAPFLIPSAAEASTNAGESSRAAAAAVGAAATAATAPALRRLPSALSVGTIISVASVASSGSGGGTPTAASAAPAHAAPVEAGAPMPAVDGWEGARPAASADGCSSLAAAFAPSPFLAAPHAFLAASARAAAATAVRLTLLATAEVQAAQGGVAASSTQAHVWGALSTLLLPALPGFLSTCDAAGWLTAASGSAPLASPSLLLAAAVLHAAACVAQPDPASAAGTAGARRVAAVLSGGAPEAAAGQQQSSGREALFLRGTGAIPAAASSPFAAPSGALSATLAAGGAPSVVSVIGKYKAASATAAAGTPSARRLLHAGSAAALHASRVPPPSVPGPESASAAGSARGRHRLAASGFAPTLPSASASLALARLPSHDEYEPTSPSAAALAASPPHYAHPGGAHRRLLTGQQGLGAAGGGATALVRHVYPSAYEGSLAAEAAGFAAASHSAIHLRLMRTAHPHGFTWPAATGHVRVLTAAEVVALALGPWSRAQGGGRGDSAAGPYAWAHAAAVGLLQRLRLQSGHGDPRGFAPSHVLRLAALQAGIDTLHALLQQLQLQRNPSPGAAAGSGEAASVRGGPAGGELATGLQVLVAAAAAQATPVSVSADASAAAPSAPLRSAAALLAASASAAAGAVRAALVRGVSRSTAAAQGLALQAASGDFGEGSAAATAALAADASALLQLCGRELSGAVAAAAAQSSAEASAAVPPAATLAAAVSASAEAAWSAASALGAAVSKLATALLAAGRRAAAGATASAPPPLSLLHLSQLCGGLAAALQPLLQERLPHTLAAADNGGLPAAEGTSAFQVAGSAADALTVAQQLSQALQLGLRAATEAPGLLAPTGAVSSLGQAAAASSSSGRTSSDFTSLAWWAAAVEASLNTLLAFGRRASKHPRPSAAAIAVASASPHASHPLHAAAQGLVASLLAGLQRASALPLPVGAAASVTAALDAACHTALAAALTPIAAVASPGGVSPHACLPAAEAARALVMCVRAAAALPAHRHTASAAGGAAAGDGVGACLGAALRQATAPYLPNVESSDGRAAAQLLLPASAPVHASTAGAGPAGAAFALCRGVSLALLQATLRAVVRSPGGHARNADDAPAPGTGAGHVLLANLLRAVAVQLPASASDSALLQPLLQLGRTSAFLLHCLSLCVCGHDQAYAGGDSGAAAGGPPLPPLLALLPTPRVLALSHCAAIAAHLAASVTAAGQSGEPNGGSGHFHLGRKRGHGSTGIGTGSDSPGGWALEAADLCALLAREAGLPVATVLPALFHAGRQHHPSDAAGAKAARAADAAAAPTLAATLSRGGSGSSGGDSNTLSECLPATWSAAAAAAVAGAAGERLLSDSDWPSLYPLLLTRYRAVLLAAAAELTSGLAALAAVAHGMSAGAAAAQASHQRGQHRPPHGQGAATVGQAAAGARALSSCLRLLSAAVLPALADVVLAGALAGPCLGGGSGAEATLGSAAPPAWGWEGAAFEGTGALLSGLLRPAVSGLAALAETLHHSADSSAALAQEALAAAAYASGAAGSLRASFAELCRGVGVVHTALVACCCKPSGAAAGGGAAGGAAAAAPEAALEALTAACVARVQQLRRPAGAATAPAAPPASTEVALFRSRGGGEDAAGASAAADIAVGPLLDAVTHAMPLLLARLHSLRALQQRQQRLRQEAEGADTWAADAHTAESLRPLWLLAAEDDSDGSSGGLTAGRGSHAMPREAPFPRPQLYLCSLPLATEPQILRAAAAAGYAACSCGAPGLRPLHNHPTAGSSGSSSVPVCVQGCEAPITTHCSPAEAARAAAVLAADAARTEAAEAAGDAAGAAASDLDPGLQGRQLSWLARSAALQAMSVASGGGTADAGLPAALPATVTLIPLHPIAAAVVSAPAGMSGRVAGGPRKGRGGEAGAGASSGPLLPEEDALTQLQALAAAVGAACSASGGSAPRSLLQTAEVEVAAGWLARSHTLVGALPQSAAGSGAGASGGRASVSPSTRRSHASSGRLLVEGCPLPAAHAGSGPASSVPAGGGYGCGSGPVLTAHKFDVTRGDDPDGMVCEPSSRHSAVVQATLLVSRVRVWGGEGSAGAGDGAYCCCACVGGTLASAAAAAASSKPASFLAGDDHWAEAAAASAALARGAGGALSTPLVASAAAPVTAASLRRAAASSHNLSISGAIAAVTAGAAASAGVPAPVAAGPLSPPRRAPKGASGPEEAGSAALTLRTSAAARFVGAEEADERETALSLRPRCMCSAQLRRQLLPFLPVAQPEPAAAGAAAAASAAAACVGGGSVSVRLVLREVPLLRACYAWSAATYASVSRAMLACMHSCLWTPLPWPGKGPAPPASSAVKPREGGKAAASASGVPAWAPEGTRSLLNAAAADFELDALLQGSAARSNVGARADASGSSALVLLTPASVGAAATHLPVPVSLLPPLLTGSAAALLRLGGGAPPAALLALQARFEAAAAGASSGAGSKGDAAACAAEALTSADLALALASLTALTAADAARTRALVGRAGAALLSPALAEAASSDATVRAAAAVATQAGAQAALEAVDAAQEAAMQRLLRAASREASAAGGGPGAAASRRELAASAFAMPSPHSQQRSAGPAAAAAAAGEGVLRVADLIGAAEASGALAAVGAALPADAAAGRMSADPASTSSGLAGHWQAVLGGMEAAATGSGPLPVGPPYLPASALASFAAAAAAASSPSQNQAPQPAPPLLVHLSARHELAECLAAWDDPSLLAAADAQMTRAGAGEAAALRAGGASGGGEYRPALDVAAVAAAAAGSSGAAGTASSSGSSGFGLLSHRLGGPFSIAGAQQWVGAVTQGAAAAPGTGRSRPPPLTTAAAAAAGSTEAQLRLTRPASPTSSHARGGAPSEGLAALGFPLPFLLPDDQAAQQARVTADATAGPSTVPLAAAAAAALLGLPPASLPFLCSCPPAAWALSPAASAATASDSAAAGGAGQVLLLPVPLAQRLLLSALEAALHPSCSLPAGPRTLRQLLSDYAELKVTHREKSVTELRRQWIREEAAASARGEDTTDRVMPDFAAMISRDPLPRVVAAEVAGVALTARLAEAVELCEQLQTAAPAALTGATGALTATGMAAAGAAAIAGAGAAAAGMDLQAALSDATALLHHAMLL
jgi:hypothetical protein